MIETILNKYCTSCHKTSKHKLEDLIDIDLANETYSAEYRCTGCYKTKILDIDYSTKTIEQIKKEKQEYDRRTQDNRPSRCR